MSHPSQDALNALNVSAEKNKTAYKHDAITAALLERFVNPASTYKVLTTMRMWEHIAVPEFTCLCPITGQPDFSHIDIYYAPDEWCVESKSLKLYMGSYRNVGMFHEAVCCCVCNHLDTLLAPFWLCVVGRFAPRGGIPFQPRAWVGNAPPDLVYNIQRQHP